MSLIEQLLLLVLVKRVIDRTAAATGVGKTSIKKFSKELQAEGKIETPEKRYKRSRVRINIDDFDTKVIRREIHTAYERKEYPTLDSLLKRLREKQVFQEGRSTLHKVVRKIGFKYKRRADGKLYVYEQPRVVQQRHDFLRRMRKNTTDKRPVVYLDETWLNAHALPERIWVDADGTGGFRHPSGKGRRLIILHAGTSGGWIPECELVFLSKTKSDDYHDEMNAKHFLEWFEQSLLPHIPPKSIIVMDQAKYHNTVVEKVPTKSSLKKVMRSWLERHQIEFEPSDLKKDLFRKIQAANPKAIYQTDKMAEKYGHEVVRLPVAHCELNPIELAWAVVKDYCRKHNQAFTLKGVKELIPHGIQQATPDMWKHFCDHVEKVAEEYWEKDGLLEDAVEEFIIEVSDSEDDDDESCDSDSEGPSDDELDRALQREEQNLEEQLTKKED